MCQQFNCVFEVQFISVDRLRGQTFLHYCLSTSQSLQVIFHFPYFQFCFQGLTVTQFCSSKRWWWKISTPHNCGKRYYNLINYSFFLSTAIMEHVMSLFLDLYITHKTLINTFVYFTYFLNGLKIIEKIFRNNEDRKSLHCDN